MSAYAVSTRGLAGRKVPQGVLATMDELLFSGSEQGAWYDPSDMSTMFQDTLGTTPVTAVEQPVGFILDKRLGLARSPLSIVGKTAGDGVVTVVGNVITVTGGTSSTDVSFSNSNSFTLLDLTFSAANGITVFAGGYPSMATAGRNTYRGAAGIYNIIRVPAGAPTTTITVHDAYNIIGNHASQGTTTKRPVLSARVNLLERSEAINTWISSHVTVAMGNYGSPIPSGTAALITGTGGGTAAVSNNSLQDWGANLGVVQTYRIVVKKGTASHVAFYEPVAANRVVFNFDTGTITQTVGWTATATSLGDEWWEITATGAKPGIYAYPFIAIGNVYWPPATTDSILLAAVQVETAPAFTRYQRVNTNTDYDADPAKFPAYLRFDGVDDALQTGNIDFTGTDKMTVVAGVRSNLNGYSNILELGPNTASENGFSLQRGHAANGDYAGVAYGTSLGYGYTSNFAAPDTSVITAQYDIAQASVFGGEISFRRNGVVSAKADSQGSAGTGNFTSKPLYIGARAGTSFPFNGRIYSLIVRGAQTPLPQIEATERYIKQKTGLP